jgi:hypothetical protein
MGTHVHYMTTAPPHTHLGEGAEAGTTLGSANTDKALLITSVHIIFFVALLEPTIVGGARVCASFVIQQMFPLLSTPLQTMSFFYRHSFSAKSASKKKPACKIKPDGYVTRLEFRSKRLCKISRESMIWVLNAQSLVFGFSGLPAGPTLINKKLKSEKEL